MREQQAQIEQMRRRMRAEMGADRAEPGTPATAPAETRAASARPSQRAATVLESLGLPTTALQSLGLPAAFRRLVGGDGGDGGGGGGGDGPTWNVCVCKYPAVKAMP